MAHDKLYGICENKCRVRLPRIKRTNTVYYNSLVIPANSYITGTSSLSTELQGINWHIVPSVTCNYYIEGMDVRAQIVGNTLYYELINRRSAAITQRNVDINFMLIERV